MIPVEAAIAFGHYVFQQGLIPVIDADTELYDTKDGEWVTMDDLWKKFFNDKYGPKSWENKALR